MAAASSPSSTSDSNPDWNCSFYFSLSVARGNVLKSKKRWTLASEMRGASHLVANEEIETDEIDGALRNFLVVVSPKFLDLKDGDPALFRVEAFEKFLNSNKEREDVVSYLYVRQNFEGTSGAEETSEPQLTQQTSVPTAKSLTDLRARAQRLETELTEVQDEIDRRSNPEKTFPAGPISKERFLFISNASERSAPQMLFPRIRDLRLRPVWSPLAWAFLMSMAASDEEISLKKARKAAKKMKRFISRDDLHGKQSQSNETSWTGVFMHFLGILLDKTCHSEFLALTQHLVTDPAGQNSCRLDGVLPYNEVFEQTQIPILIEVKKHPANYDDAHNQLARYCSSLARVGVFPHFLTFLVVFDPTKKGSVECCARLLLPALPVKVHYPYFVPMELFSGTLRISKLFAVICHTLQLFDKRFLESQPTLGSDHINFSPGPIPTLAKHSLDGRALAVKVFHFDRQDPETYRRTVVSEKMIPGTEYLLDLPQLKIISYPWIEGEIRPDLLLGRQLIHAAQALQTLYSTFLLGAHGDIRFANLIFKRDGRASWIDFDYSIMKDEIRNYPPSWCRNVPDAERHEGARAGQPISRIHDVFSFASMLAYYSPVKPAKEERWKTICTQCKLKTTIADVIRTLKPSSDWELKLSNTSLGCMLAIPVHPSENKHESLASMALLSDLI